MAIIKVLNQFGSKQPVIWSMSEKRFVSQADIATLSISGTPDSFNKIASQADIVHTFSSDMDGGAPAGTAQLFNYINGTDPADAWNNEVNAWDGDPDGTFAERQIDKQTKETTKYLHASNNNGWVIGESTITKVRIGIRMRFSTNPASAIAWVIPVFGGLTDGNEYSFTSPDSTLATFWVDVTNDPNAPNPWLWTGPDIAGLDVKFFGEETGNEAVVMAIYRIYVEVTYE